MRQQSNPLVIANGFNVDSRMAGQLSDREADIPELVLPHTKFLDPVVATGCIVLRVIRMSS
jgi:hypothetical protein